MAWNEPGSNNQDPWNSGNRNNDQKPPELDEALRKLQQQLAGLFGGNRKSNPHKRKQGQSEGTKGLLSIALVVGVLAYLWSAVYIVDEKESAVILRLGRYVETVEPGLHIYFPPIEQRFKEVVTEYKTYHLKQEMLTEDENIVDVSLSVQYYISNLKDYVLNVANPSLSLREAAQSALRSAVGGTQMHNVLTEGREALAQDVKLRLQKYIDTYKSGLMIAKVNIESTQAPKQVQAAFDDVIRAREDEERSKNKAEAYSNKIIPEAKGKASRILEEAIAYKSEVISRAEGETNRFENLLKEYTKNPKIMEERLYIDAMRDVFSNTSKVMISTKGNSNIMYLPLDKMVNSTSSNKVDTTELSNEDLSTLSDRVVDELTRRTNGSSRTGRNQK